MVTILKVERNGEIRRKLFQSTPDYAAVTAALGQLWPDIEACLVKYEDEDGDACTLADTTFDDFLCTIASSTPGRSVLRLRLLPAPARPSAPAEQPAASANALAEPKDSTEAFCPGAFGAQCDDGEEDDSDDEDDDEDEEQGDEQDAAARALRAGAEAAIRTLVGSWARHCRCRSEWSHPGSPSARGASDDGAGGMDAEEKVCIVLAAFDADGDGRLSFREWAALVKAAWGVDMPPMAFHLLCGHLGVGAEEGLSADDMARAYSFSRTLDWDYAVARRKLEESEGPAPSAPAWPSPCCPEPAPCC